MLHALLRDGRGAVPRLSCAVHEAALRKFCPHTGQFELSSFASACAARGHVGTHRQSIAKELGRVGRGGEMAHSSDVALSDHLVNTWPTPALVVMASHDHAY